MTKNYWSDWQKKANLTLNVEIYSGYLNYSHYLLCNEKRQWITDIKFMGDEVFIEYDSNEIVLKRLNEHYVRRHYSMKYHRTQIKSIKFIN